MQKLLSTAQLNAMKVAFLRDLCETEGVETTGPRNELVSRLCALQPSPTQQPIICSSAGHLFSKDAPPQRVAHGAAVNLKGSQWQACVESDCLVLRKTRRTDDKKERTVSRIANIKREVEGRQQEVEALAGDIASVMEETETVTCCCRCCFLCFATTEVN
jgi:hypothetical protein